MAGGLKGRNNKAQCEALGMAQGNGQRAESPHEGPVLSWCLIEPRTLPFGSVRTQGFVRVSFALGFVLRPLQGQE